LTIIQIVAAVHVFKYDAPVIPLQNGVVWRINGVFKLAHVVNLERMQCVVNELTNEITTFNKQRRGMTSTSPRRLRSIDWLGSAWKWVAGSPDGSDWNAILKAQGNVERNNDQQIRINTRLFDSTHESLHRLNDVIAKVNSIDGDFHATTAVLHKAIILAGEVNEMTRACQLAKTGVVNSNLLDHDEVETILSEVDSLPYQNMVEAVEFSRPTILTSGTSLLYILAMPKVTDRKYRLIYLDIGSISDGRQIVLEYNKLAVDARETYAVLGNCLSIGNTTVFQEKDLHKLAEDSFVPRLVKGGHAACDYVRNDQEVVELIDDGMIFLTHFNGTVATSAKNYHLEGSFIVQYDNETITVGNRNYSSYSSTHLMSMPAVLTQITATGYQLSLNYVHDFKLKNLQKLSNMSTEILISYFTEVLMASIFMAVLYIVWRKITSTKGIPKLCSSTLGLEPQTADEPTTKA